MPKELLEEFMTEKEPDNKNGNIEGKQREMEKIKEELRQKRGELSTLIERGGSNEEREELRREIRELDEKMGKLQTGL